MFIFQKGEDFTNKLIRKRQTLRKAQARFDKVSKRSKQFKIRFERSPNCKGKFRIRALIVRDEKTFHGNNRGLIHKAVNVKYRIYGDKPSVTKALKSWKPKSKKGKFTKASAVTVNFIAHDSVKTTVDTALAAETIGLKSADIAGRETKNKLKQKYTREAVDDYHRGTFETLRLGVDAVKGTHRHFKQKKQHKLEKAKFKLKKAEYAVFKEDTFKPKIKSNKSDLKSAKADFKRNKQNYKNSSKSNIQKALLIRRKQKFKVNKRDIKFDNKKLKSEKESKSKELKNQRKIAKNSSTGFLVLKPVGYSADRMKASAWQKAVNEDQNNDVLHALDSAKRRIIEPTAQKISKPERLQRQQKKRDRLNDSRTKSNNRLNKQENKLNKKRDNYKKRKKKTTPKKSKKTAKDTITAVLKATYKFVKNVYEKEVKKFFAAIAVPILIILLVFAFITMIFSSISSSSTFTLGTYAAQDYDLSEAEKYYTELAYKMNAKILKVSDTDNWKDGLADFGANTSDLKDKPDNWYWGRSSIFNWEPVYDFNVYKLWSFLCAYYYNFDSADNGDIKYWKFKDSTKDLLSDIFYDEYEFVYHYDNTSHWEYKNQFESHGYYSIDGAGVTGEYGYVNISYPDALPFSGYNNGNTIYFDLSNGEVLNYNDDYSATGWYLKDQYCNDTDPNGNTYEGWFNDDETCGYGIWSDGVLVIPIPYVIPSESWCSFLQKYDWVTDCRLYYNVQQNKSFDKVIEDTLKSKSDGDDRWQYYNLLVGNEDSKKMYGNHQTIYSMLPNPSIRDYTLKREFGYEMTGWNEPSDGLYQGIKVYADSGTLLKMPFDGKITNVDTDNDKITIRKDDIEYWYDGTGGTERDTEITISNAVLLSGFANGDSINQGDEFAKTTAGNVNFHIYLDTDGYGWDYIDPRLVLY